MELRPARLASLLLLAALAQLTGLVPGKAVPPRRQQAEAAIDFSKQVRPILSENCFACHGPDASKRKAKLRLDTKEGAFAALRHGGHAFVPGKPQESEVIARISATEATEIMPPPASRKKLKAAEIALLRRWVEQGAHWSEHWAFTTPPRRPPVPSIRDAQPAVRNPIDAFIRARLEKEGLKPSPEADKVTLIRRVTLDLTGLPPTPAEVDAFLADRAAGSYERLVDRLLESSRYGEHMARFWLDAARYGDTHGLHLDNYREIWPFRDWVIRAFNKNMPFDRFVIEQLAGDLLPSPTVAQMVATGFNRCNVSTSEGGSIEEEVYVRNVLDRTETFGTVFLGLTIGCARCHDHKFDPIKTKEFYSLFAFFNSIEGSPLDGNSARHEPTIRVPTPEFARQLARLQARADEVRKQMTVERAKVVYDDAADAREPEVPQRAEYVWIDDALPAGAKAQAGGGVNVPWNFVGPPQPVHSGSRSVLLKAKGLRQVVIQDTQPGLRVGAGDKLFAYVYLTPKNPPKEIMLQWNSGQWAHRAYWGANVIPWGRDKSPERYHAGPLPKPGQWVRLEVDAAAVDLKPGAVITGWAFTQHDGTAYWDRAGIVTQTPQAGQPYDTLAAWVRVQRAAGGAGLPANIQAAVKLDRAKRSPPQQQELRDYFVANAWSKTRALLAPYQKQLAAIEQERTQLESKLPSTLVFRERKQPKPAYVLKRGEYDQHGDKVERGTPAALPPLAEGLPRNRLGLAKWLVARAHPLTARVAVNRFWQQFFGVGLVKTAEDFGSQGEPPSHAHLLDWLAVQFIDDGWDVKKTVRRLVTSATYRQSSKVTAERLTKDPANRLLSRGPRFRLDAETLRDQALFVSGLLVEKVGGPSVKPPQPPGLWEAVGYTDSNTARFTADRGRDKVHRRSLYIFWKRTAPPPQMSTFDAPSRESCIVRRERTNTPLQALLLLNETQYVEAARMLAERALRQGGKREDRIAFMFRLTTCRQPDAKETVELLAAYRAQKEEYARDPAAAKKFIHVGETKPDPKFDPVEVAAWTMVANVLLNLDEVLTKG